MLNQRNSQINLHTVIFLFIRTEKLLYKFIFRYNPKILNSENVNFKILVSAKKSFGRSPMIFGPQSAKKLKMTCDRQKFTEDNRRNVNGQRIVPYKFKKRDL